ncbi:MAG: sigma-70 family RNA polymerase sigma factor [Phycisphaerales bacterium]|nr:sigma-70 family RNA polymerase sigma factor [Phycisphaerales bacterium]
MIEGMDAPDQHPSSVQIESLCQSAVRGDTAALERLLWIYHGRLLSAARRKIGVDWQGKLDAEDILQETYVHVFADIRGFQYQGEDSFLHWASRILDHRFIDQVRRMRARKRDAQREIAPAAAGDSRYDGFIARCFPDLNTPSIALSRQDALRAIVMCMAQLPEHYREVVQRHYLDEEPLAAIASDMNRSEDAVRRMASRALDQLEICLGRASDYVRSRG